MNARKILVVLTTASLLALTGCGWLTSAEERVARAERLVQEGQDRAAVIELQNAVRSKPELVSAHLLLAKISVRLGDPQSAIKELQQALAQGAPPTQVSTVMADAKLALGQGRELLVAIDAGELVLEEPARSAVQGDAHLALGDVQEAAKDFNRALAKDASFHRARIGLAESFARQGQSDEALVELDKVLAADPDNAAAWFGKGQLLSRRGEAKAAAEALVKARQHAPGSLSVSQYSALLVALSEAHLAGGDSAGADAAYKELVTRSPEWPVTQLVGARIAMSKQDYATAAAEAQKAARAAPQLSQAKLLLAAALAAQGNLNQAEAQLSEIVRQAPENVEARNLLAEVNLRLRRPEVAMQLLGDSAGPSGDAQRDALLGWANLQRGDEAAAIALLERSAAAQPNNATAQIDLAIAYLADGQNDKAVSLLKSAPADHADKRRDSLLVAAVAAASGKEAASAEMQRIVAANPKDVATLNLGAGYFLRARDLARASELLHRALSLDPKHAQTLMNLARVEVAEGNLASAKSRLEQVVGAEPNNTMAKMQLAEIVARGGDVPGAIQQLEQIRKSDPKAIEARLLLARSYLRQRKTAEANDTIREVMAIAPTNAAVANAVGSLYQEAGRFDEAAASFRTAAQQDPNNPQYVVSLGRVQMARGDSTAARESFERALRLQADSVVANGMLALLDLREGKSDAATARVAKLKSDRKNDPAVATLEGDIAMAAKSYAVAANAYAEAARLSPSGAAAIRTYRSRELGKLADPLEPLEQWLRTHPDDTSVQLVLAEAHMARGQMEPAIALYERAIKGASGGSAATVLNNLAWLYHTKGDARAVTTAKAAYDKAPENPAIADTYGWILVQQGDVKNGLAILEKAAADPQAPPDVRYHYAYALARGGNQDAARRELESLLRTTQKYASEPDARRLLQELGG